MFKSFSAMILAAGFGKRMLHLTSKTPKPLIEINNVSLLKNSIDFLFKIGCKKIVINTHYKHKLISDFINNNYKCFNIITSYENVILDTAGGVKNAISLFDDNKILVTNCDIFWKTENENDVINIISNFQLKDECRLLLVEKENAYGMNNKKGDFFLKDGIVKRWQVNEKIFYYSGLQMISSNIFNDFISNKFSFNDVWDLQIKKNALYGNLMKSSWYHVGELKGLKIAINSDT